MDLLQPEEHTDIRQATRDGLCIGFLSLSPTTGGGDSLSSRLYALGLTQEEIMYDEEREE
jgi:hypothetical protein